MVEEHLIVFVALDAEHVVCDLVWHHCDGRGILSGNDFKMVFHIGAPIKKMNPEFFALGISVFLTDGKWDWKWDWSRPDI